MPFTNEEIRKSFNDEIAEKEDLIDYWAKDENYPKDTYDYSTDDYNDYEYQQDLYNN